MSKRFICRGCDKRMIKNDCVAFVPDSATAEMKGCLFQRDEPHDSAEWEEIPKEPEIIFDHGEENTDKAISGSSREVSDELFKEIMANPEDFFGEDYTVSMAAEFINENSNNPDVLSALARLVITGLLK